MGLSVTLKQAYHLASPYFSPKAGNWSRIGMLAGAVLMAAYRAKTDGTRREQIQEVYTFFWEKKPLEEFNKVFQAAGIGYFAIIGTDIATEWFREKLNISFQQTMTLQTLNRWLENGNYRGVKARDDDTSSKISDILAEKIPDFTFTTLMLLIWRIGDLAVNSFSLYRIYQLSKPLYLKSLPFPLNRQGGIFAVMVSLLGLFTLFKIRAQQGIETSDGIVRDKRFKALKRVKFLEKNALQMASLPQKYHNQIITDIQAKGRDVLATSASYEMSRFFNDHFNFIFPHAFELAVVYLASLFAKNDPEHFVYKDTFSPLLNESLAFMWRSTFLIQNILNDWHRYRRSIEEIEALHKNLDQYEKEVVDLPIEKGERFSVKGLTSTIKNEDEEPIFSQLSLTLEPGFVYLIYGGNGCGKTVFLNTIQGYQGAEQGTITTPENVWYLQPKIEIDSAEQSFPELLRQTFGMNEVDEVDKVRTYLQKFKRYFSNGKWKISQVASGNRSWSTLSDGLKQIFNLAVVLTIMENAKTPYLILADEILGQADALARVTALSLLKSLAEKKTHTILLVDHNKEGFKSEAKDAFTPEGGKMGFKIFRQ